MCVCVSMYLLVFLFILASTLSMFSGADPSEN